MTLYKKLEKISLRSVELELISINISNYELTLNRISRIKNRIFFIEKEKVKKEVSSKSIFTVLPPFTFT